MIKNVVTFGVGFGVGRMGNEPVVPVVKRVVIFGAGACLGYTIAMNSIEPQGEIKKEAAEFIRTVKAVIVDAHLDIKNEMAEAKKASEQDKKKQKDETVVEGTATEEPLDTPPSEETDDAGQQGETP